ncbi:MAG: hypothetical protein C4617_04485 [Candidatus Liberibacter europaeus]|uniref:Uncharacterized protein n=1 Tax=Candidatus Liberibacter europaeus TaxID=744859 RepID=A0A2T4VWW6_9HYPH|nr:hypothetical protein [Candidatus Liberibacter europaeus]PTL86267.1 MAG: hypothetical protein C4617_04485 [Candidatus Liberibacter europaeus]
MDWIKPALSLLKNAFSGEDMSLMSFFLKDSKNQAISQIISYFLPVSFIRLLHTALIALSYHGLYQGDPTIRSILFFVIFWFVFSMISTILIASKNQENIIKNKHEIRFSDMDNINKSYKNLYNIKKYLSKENFKESINTIELFLKPYGVPPLASDVEFEDAEDYLQNIFIISNLIRAYNQKEAKEVRIRYNEKHKQN